MTDAATLLFQIQPGLGTPIYRQVIEQVERLIASGALRPGDTLPSIRDMARAFEVNQMTISKAYSLLEAQGVLRRNRGKRMEVTAEHGAEHGREHRLELIRPALLEVVAQARQLALTSTDLIDELRTVLETQDDH